MPFSGSRTEAITTFAYSDISTGKVVVNHYGGQASGAYVLSKNLYWSDGIQSLGIGTHNFDLVFTRPRTIEGDMIINVPLIVLSGAVHNSNMNVTIQKISGGAPITLAGPKTSRDWTTPLGAGGTYVAHAAMMTIDIPKTVFRKDDTLRVVVIPYVTDSVEKGIGHDPKNREFSIAMHADSEDAPSQMMVQIPFKLDV